MAHLLVCKEGQFIWVMKLRLDRHFKVWVHLPHHLSCRVESNTLLKHLFAGKQVPQANIRDTALEV